MKKNIEERIDKGLLRDVADLIDREPHCFNQNSFGDADRDISIFHGEECETPCCVAGLIGILRGYRLNPDEPVSEFAKKELNVNSQESDALFDHNWALLFDQSTIKQLLGPELGTRLPNPRNAVIVLRAIADDPSILERAKVDYGYDVW